MSRVCRREGAMTLSLDASRANSIDPAAIDATFAMSRAPNGIQVTGTSRMASATMAVMANRHWTAEMLVAAKGRSAWYAMRRR